MGNDYGIAATMDAAVMVDGNYFLGVKDPCLVGYAGSGPGNLVQRNNVFDNCGRSPQTRGTVGSFPYAYSVDNPRDIPSIVRNGAGVGKI